MLDGIDISRYQGNTPSLVGLEFVWVRAVYGTTADSAYSKHANAVKDTHKVLGAYAFGVGGVAISSQVKAFLDVASNPRADLLALDLESNSPGDSMSAAEAKEFIRQVHLAGRKIGLYHSESGFPQNLGQDYNWVANWSHQPEIPWTFWQYRGSPLDLDRFNGNLINLMTLAGTLPPTPKPPTFTVHVKHGATVKIAHFEHGPCIKRWSSYFWSGRTSSAGCKAPVRRKKCGGGLVTVVYVTSGKFKGNYVHIGSGVSVTAR
jgi:hypothetical protein